MFEKAAIEKIIGREILDSRGNPTVQADVILSDGTVGTASVPSGASTGAFEALELRDGDKSRYGGKGVLKAVSHINSTLNTSLKGLDATNTRLVDSTLINADGTPDKSKIGANALLAVSLAAAGAAANHYHMPLYRFIGGVSGDIMPVPMMNILNGGAHASNNIDIQEFMIVPKSAECFRDGLRMCAEVYRSLDTIIKSKGLSSGIGDEGGFAPDLSGEREAIELIIDAIERAGYQSEKDFNLALDAAASEWKSGGGKYLLPKKNSVRTTDELISEWSSLCSQYPIVSIEDPLSEDDYDGWSKITALLGKKIQLVGDDLFVTNVKRINDGIEKKCANAVLIKPNQIGTLSETLSAIRLARRNGYGTVISHRSGETEDTFIADLAVGMNAGQIKTGAPCRSERTAKYNRLLKIEEELNS